MVRRSAAERLGERRGVLQSAAEQHLGGRRGGGVVLHDERGERLVRLGEQRARKMTGGAEIAAAAHQHDARPRIRPASPTMTNTSASRSSSGSHGLLCLDALQRGELVAQLRGALELEAAAGLLHALLQLRLHLVAAALEHLDRGGHVLRVRLAADQPDARRRAAPDLVLQARAAAVGEEAVRAVTDAKQLLQLVERLAHRAGVRKRPEIASRRAARAAVELQPRELVLHVQVDVGEALVVAQHDVEARLVRLDEVVLEQQRLGFGVGDRDLDGTDLRHQRLHLRVDVAGGEVGADPVLETARLADVQQLLAGAEHAVHAGAPRQCGDVFLRIKHAQAVASVILAAAARAARRARRRAPPPR